jgi:hypothetical protein
LIPTRAERCLFSIVSSPILGYIQLPIPFVKGVLSMGVKQFECEADHLLPSSAEIMNRWS